MKSMVFLIPYFGQFPEWAPLFFETINRNPTINFIFYTDCDTTGYNFPNVVFKKMSFDEYIIMAKQKASIEFNPANAYKLCDLRPLYPKIHYEDIKEYDFYGWTDMDILFGDIRLFYSDDILKKYSVLSTHQVRISGHLALFRNTANNRDMYKKIYDWRNKLVYPNFVGIDEHGITNAYTMTIFDKFNEKFQVQINNWLTRKIKAFKMRKLYLKEQYTTPFTTIPWIDGTINSQQPDTWYYKDGRITNSRDGDREFMYIHFMNFKNSQWRHDETKAPWEGKEKVCFVTKEEMITGIVINCEGIIKA
ncbi:MAG TPA: hypothetical protein DCQ26_01465 [Marinilabiliales bacterium]|nr:MAG: hypothetical protein A2W95_08410 [Bacteroidetes bacterium GWA2_40_14]OFX57675.1 MAG: hypothetical protein A2W84_16060 [Bacteroidetes bacterium GWC2_40_13]OFX75886.1 MAG: hypothetical protein A2W96_05955 [Bacteroidetes bacterium GWD2_40_43]OFX88624.1 MAG: hypothetical protein A2W97_01150 [Bacteroidetes bacterium GWE2_40_63]OFY20352.1 MAG: hypothetical protein A2W88_18075 [Bacteroidetes bacterium GWF2_40_13]OFZ24727.1 MAG: hypothetical protein A2437_02495 [Bacteroidetes bacterium RIFOXYC